MSIDFRTNYLKPDKMSNKSRANSAIMTKWQFQSETQFQNARSITFLLAPHFSSLLVGTDFTQTNNSITLGMS
jgi:hypothetical protein